VARSKAAVSRCARIVLSAAGGLTAFLTAAAPASAGYGPGFEEETLCSGFVEPTAIAFLRPKILLVTEKSGAVYAVRNGVVRPAPVFTVDAAVERERGLNGIAVDPGFRRSGYVYVHYTVDQLPRVNRVSRFLVSRSGIGPEEILVDGLSSGAGIHNSGCLRFAPDGTLFFTAGDGGQATYRVQDLAYLNGKLCRIHPDGTAPADNPFAALPGARP
jgi:glucose/arabinose dehydrogenase